MRWYRLRIGKDVKITTLGGSQMQFQMEAQKSLPPRKQNPTPLNIQFNVTANADLSAQVGSVIKIYNVDQNSYARLRNYVGAPIHLEAGFDEGSPMVQKLGYPTVLDKTIVLGRVQSVVGNFQSNDPWIAISCGPYAVDNSQLTDISTLYEELGGEQTQTSVVPLQIPPESTQLGEILTKAFEWFLDTSWSVTASFGLAQATLTGTSQALFTGVRTLMQLVAFARTKFNVAAAFDTTINHCMLYKCGNLNGDYGDYAELASLASSSGATIIKPAEFLEQPEALGVNEISATIALRADLHLGSLVTLVGMMPQMGSFTGMDSFISKGVADNTKLFNPGVYMVKGINHNGEFYGTSSTSWSTQLSLIYASGAIAAEAAKNKSAKTEQSKGVQK